MAITFIPENGDEQEASGNFTMFVDAEKNLAASVKLDIALPDYVKTPEELKTHLLRVLGPLIQDNSDTVQIEVLYGHNEVKDDE